MTYRFSYHDRANADVVARALGLSTAKIVSIEGNKWRIAFDDGKHYSHGSKGVPATQLRAWLDGALSVAGFAQGKLDDAKRETEKALRARQEARSETVIETLAEIDFDEIAEHVKERCTSEDLTEAFWEYMDARCVTVQQIIDFVDDSAQDLTIFTNDALEEDRESTIQRALEAHPLFHQAVRVAYARNESERQEDIRELTHILVRDWNAYNQAALI